MLLSLCVFNFLNITVKQFNNILWYKPKSNSKTEQKLLMLILGLTVLFMVLFTLKVHFPVPVSVKDFDNPLH